MKKVLFSVLAIAAFTSCSKNNNDADPEGPANIVLSAGIPSASVQPGVKAPVNPGDEFTAGIAGWESNSGGATYSNEQTWKATAANISANSQAQVITLSPTQVYNTDKNIKTYMKAWYPQGKSLTNGVVEFDNTDGSVDAMLAAEISGSKRDKDNKTLAFVHKTTQFKFMVKKGVGLAEGTTVDKIVIKNAELPEKFNLTSNPSTVNYKSAADLTVPGITAGALVIGTTTAGDPVGNPVMIKPMAGNTLLLDVTTSKGNFPNVEATINGDTDFAEGKAYTITLTFGREGIDLKATVAEWTTGTGSGTVD